MLESVLRGKVRLRMLLLIEDCALQEGKKPHARHVIATGFNHMSRTSCAC